MQWLRDAGWFVAIGFVVVYLIWLKPQKAPNPNDTKALIEQHRTEAAERQARLDQELARIDLETTQRLLKQVGKAYREHLAARRSPRRPRTTRNCSTCGSRAATASRL
jgi:hypothetical protein